MSKSVVQTLFELQQLGVMITDIGSLCQHLTILCWKIFSNSPTQLSLMRLHAVLPGPIATTGEQESVPAPPLLSRCSQKHVPIHLFSQRKRCLASNNQKRVKWCIYAWDLESSFVIFQSIYISITFALIQTLCTEDLSGIVTNSNFIFCETKSSRGSSSHILSYMPVCNPHTTWMSTLNK